MEMDADKLLQCPVCYQVPRNKIFSCSQGHKICESCLAEIMRTSLRCPMARCRYPIPPPRNLDLEDIVKNSNVKFICSSPQCKEEMEREELEKHEAECKFRLVPCPDPRCAKMLQFEDIAYHIQTKVRKTELEEQCCRFLIGETDPGSCDSSVWEQVALWENDSLVFYPMPAKRGQLWYFWIKVHAGPEVAAKWMFSARTENLETGIRMEFMVSVSPVDRSSGEVIDSGECLLMSNRNIEKLTSWVENQHCVVKFEVFKEEDDSEDLSCTRVTIRTNVYD